MTPRVGSEATAGAGPGSKPLATCLVLGEAPESVIHHLVGNGFALSKDTAADAMALALPEYLNSTSSDLTFWSKMRASKPKQVFAWRTGHDSVARQSLLSGFRVLHSSQIADDLVLLELEPVEQSTHVAIRTMTPADYPEVARIFQQGIETGNATFDSAPEPWEDWDAGHVPSCRLIATADNAVVGWAALSPVSRRECYRGVGEVSVYVDESARGTGVGRSLLQRLVQESEEHGFWTLTAGIFVENQASIALHESCGFRLYGVQEREGRLNGVWRDVARLERRSDKIGT